MGQDPPIKVQTRCKKIWYGNGYGGFYVNPDLLNSSSIVYSIGIGEDISFDLDVIKNHSSTVFGFDPTPRSLQWVNSQQFPSNFHFSAVGISDHDGTTTFFEPEDEKNVSFSAVINHEEGKKGHEAEVKTLHSMMIANNHSRIDVLKMDIEGAEYAVVKNLVQNGLPVNQVLIEFHHRFISDGIKETMNVVKQLNDLGFKIFGISDSGNEVSFIKVP